MGLMDFAIAYLKAYHKKGTILGSDLWYGCIEAIVKKSI